MRGMNLNVCILCIINIKKNMFEEPYRLVWPIIVMSKTSVISVVCAHSASLWPVSQLLSGYIQQFYVLFVIFCLFASRAFSSSSSSSSFS